MFNGFGYNNCETCLPVPGYLLTKLTKFFIILT
jgi:hypothetical protein